MHTSRCWWHAVASGTQVGLVDAPDRVMTAILAAILALALARLTEPAPGSRVRR
jgi:hypothetical protein